MPTKTPSTPKTPARKPATKKTTKVERYEPHPSRLRFYVARVDYDGPIEYENQFFADISKMPTDEPVLAGDGVEPNVVSSLCTDGLHRPVIDLDVPCHLERSTNGNAHLYIDKPIRWEKYVDILTALRNAGLIERGYFNASYTRNQTFVRLPGVVKPAGQLKTRTFEF